MPTEPDPARRQQVNAALARAMGWRYDPAYVQRPWVAPSEIPTFHYSQPPNFYEDAAASRELVLWFSKSDRWPSFLMALNDLLDVSSDFTQWEDFIPYFTAPLPTLAEAAFAAIGGDAESLVADESTPPELQARAGRRLAK